MSKVTKELNTLIILLQYIVGAYIGCSVTSKLIILFFGEYDFVPKAHMWSITFYILQLQSELYYYYSPMILINITKNFI